MAILRASASAEGAEPASRPSARAARRPIRRAIASATSAALRFKPSRRRGQPQVTRKPTRRSTWPSGSSRTRAAIERRAQAGDRAVPDLSGSTAAASGSGPRSYRRRDRCFALMLDEVHRYEGTVIQFSATASWRCSARRSRTRTRTPRRARRPRHPRALAAYQRELPERGVDFRARNGSIPGRWWWARSATASESSYTAIGDTTNLAARLEQTGDAGARS